MPKLYVIWLLASLLTTSIGCAKKTERIRKDQISRMMKIHMAVLQYDNQNGQYPANLDDLITSNLLKNDEITIQRNDGSWVRPTFYPNPNRPNEPLLVFDLGDPDAKATIASDGSIRYLSKIQGEQAAPRNR